VSRGARVCARVGVVTVLEMERRCGRVPGRQGGACSFCKRKQEESELVVDVDCVHECLLMLGRVVHRNMAVHQVSAGAAARRGEFGSSPCCSCGRRLEDAELAGVACMRSGGRRDWANELKTCSCGGVVAHDAEEAGSLGNAIVRAVLAVCVVCCSGYIWPWNPPVSVELCC
jgi:hypothetical protein